MSDDTTAREPTTDEVRNTFAHYGFLSGPDRIRMDRFDRWLAAHDAEVRAAALCSRQSDEPQTTSDPLPWISKTGWRTAVQAWHPTHGLSKFAPRPEFPVPQSDEGEREHRCLDPRAGTLRVDKRGRCFWCGEVVPQ